MSYASGQTDILITVLRIGAVGGGRSNHSDSLGGVTGECSVAENWRRSRDPLVHERGVHVRV